jgi:hypothetical protein
MEKATKFVSQHSTSFSVVGKINIEHLFYNIYDYMCVCINHIIYKIILI